MKCKESPESFVFCWKPTLYEIGVSQVAINAQSLVKKRKEDKKLQILHLIRVSKRRKTCLDIANVLKKTAFYSSAVVRPTVLRCSALPA